ncbi:hypothetical protein [Planctomicrobium sp. SH527]|uniref:hypothetical protein n=1 Tax=Planctomicrobium sp. SH527 TaxID=3448123 RepID=UPI003F5C80F9
MEHYKVFYNGDWAVELFRLANGKSKLSDLIFDVTLAFKGISTARAVPLLAVDVAEAYAKGHDLGALSNTLTLKLVSRITAEIDQRVVVTSSQRDDLKAAMLEIMYDFYSRAEGKELPFPRQELWDEFAKVDENEDKDSPENEFRLALWSSQRICYSAFFFAYEDFLVRCLEVYLNTEVQTGRTFPDICKQALGNDLADQCWNCEEIQIAKLIRNALVHAGGRETEKLKNRNHRCSVIDGQMQIVPGNVSELYLLLTHRAKRLVKWASRQSVFA